MSAAKHTPGPWHIARFEASTVEIRNDRGLTVAEVGDSSQEDEANAHLIAAAPELLEALRCLIDGDEGMWRHDAPSEAWDEIARAAIAKATGSAQ